MYKTLLFLLLTSSMSSVKTSAATLLTANVPIALSGKVGKFDFMEVDSKNRRLLAAHSGAGTLAVLDLKSGKPLPAIEVGNVQGVAVDGESDTYILGDADEHKIVFVSSKTLTKTGELTMSGPVDAIAFDPKNGTAYAGEDDGTHLWVVDVKKQKLISTILLPGVPEFVVYDPKSDRIYQNIKTKNSLVVINPATNEIESIWMTLPAAEPHGMAISEQTGHIFIAGRNGKLVEIDLKSGKLVAQSEIATGTDQISFDSKTKIIYCASKGFISAARETNSGIETISNSPSHVGAHTLAVDEVRHEVWISYADKEHSYLQKFKAYDK